MKLRWLLGSVSILLFLTIPILFNLAGQELQIDKTPTAVIYMETVIPTPIVFPPPTQGGLPDLICPYIRDIRKGYSWNGITIGESSQDDLESMLNTSGTFEIIYPDEGTLANSLRYRWIYEENGENIYKSLYVCFQDEIIVMLYVSENHDKIEDLIIKFGLPNIVTWSWWESGRVAFWFEQGVIAEIFVDKGDNSSFGTVTRLFYFIPQDVDGYLTRWPFSITRQEQFIPSNSSIPIEQNPFDFDSMIATMTAMPTFTPTASP